MPLNKTGSKQAVGQNIKAELTAGKPQKQAVAIAMDVQRRSGGPVQSQSGYRKNKTMRSDY